MPQLHIVERRPSSLLDRYPVGSNLLLDARLREMGYDPNRYAAIPEDDLEEYLGEYWSGPGSAWKAAKEHAGAGVGAAGAMMTAGAYMTGTGIGFWPGLALMGGAGLLGAVGGSLGQDVAEAAVLTDRQEAELARERQEAYMANPNWSFAGSMAPAGLAFRPSPTQFVKGLSGVKQALTGKLGWGKGFTRADVPTSTSFTTRSGLAGPTRSKLGFESPLGRVAPGEKQALAEMALGATFDTAIEGGFQLAHGKFDPSRLAIAAGIGATLQRPTFKPPGLKALVAKGELRAEAKGRNPNKMFNPWREPIPAYATLRSQIGDVGYTSLYNKGEVYEGDIGRKVGVIEDALTPTDAGVAATIEAHVTRGASFLEPFEPGPAARSMQRPGIGAVPLTADEVAAAQMVSPERHVEIYGASEAIKQKARLSREEGVQELEVAQQRLAVTKDEGVTFSVREKKQAQTAVNKARRKIDKADKVLEADVSRAHERAITRLFSSAAEPVRILDPVTGKRRTIKVAKVPREASERIVDRDGEPLIDRLDIWEPTGVDPKTGTVIQNPVRVLANGSVQKAVVRPDGTTGWQFIDKITASRLQKQFHDHAIGMRKLIGEARRKLEIERREVTGKTGRRLKPLDPEVIDILNRLALIRGFNLTEAIRSIDHPEGGLAGGFATYDTRSVTVDPRRMSKHAIAHEGLHNWLDDLQWSSNPRDRKLRQDFLELFGEFGPRRARLDLPAEPLSAVHAREERAVEFLGRAMTEKVANRNQKKFMKLLEEAKIRWKDRFGIPLTDKQLKNYMLLKYEHDLPFMFNDDMIAGFTAHLYGARATPELKQKVLEDVRAGRPIRRDDAYYEKRIGTDPWKGLKFQEAKKRFNSRGEEVVSEEESLRLMKGVKRQLGIEDEPGADPQRFATDKGMINKILQDTEGLGRHKFQKVDAAYERELARPIPDMDKVKLLVNEAARLGGFFPRMGFHGTTDMMGGTRFDVLDPEKIGQGIGISEEIGLAHVSLDPKVANQASGYPSKLSGKSLAARNVTAESDLFNVYFKAERPLVFNEDAGAWTIPQLVNLLRKSNMVALADDLERTLLDPGVDVRIRRSKDASEGGDVREFLELRQQQAAEMPPVARVLETTDPAYAMSKTERVDAVRSILNEHGYDSIKYTNQNEISRLKTDWANDSYIVFEANQIKSADPVTRDIDSDRVIPLGERFGPKPSMRYQKGAVGERTLSDDEIALFASSRDRAKHMAETFDKFVTDIGAFDPERRILSPLEGKEYTMLVDPRWWLQKLQYSIAETDQLLVRPFKGLLNSEITDATKKQALYIRDAHNRLEMVEKRYIGRFVEPLIMELRTLGLNKADVTLLGLYRTLRRMVRGRERRDFDDTPEFRKVRDELDKLEPQIKGKLHAANETLDRFFTETRLEHAANGPMVWRKNRWVKVSNDPDHVDKTYDPYMLSRDASTILRKKSHTKEGKDLQDKIIKHWKEESNLSENELRDTLLEYVAVINNKDSYKTTGGETKSLVGASKFQALRKTEGLSMPVDLIDPDPFIRAQRYAGRFAKDMAWYTQIESDNIVRAIRDLPDQTGMYTHRKVGDREPTTPTLKEHFGDDVDVGYGDRAQETFNNLDEVHAGFHDDMDLFVLRANRMITANWLGLYSGARDFATAFEKASHYMRLQDYPLMLKAVTHFGDAWKQSHRAGANRDKFSSIEFAMGSVDEVADSFSTVADFSQKWSGRELFEKGTRAIQFSLGKLLMRSYLNSASKDPHVQRILTTMGRFADVDTVRLRKNPTEITESDIQKLATAWVEINQGTYGVRGVPSTMIRGKGSYVLSLSRWSVEKFNRYQKDVILPILDKKTYGKRDFRPLIKATLGAAVMGTALNEIGKMMNGKESYEPSLEEVLESPSGMTDFIYHAMHLANLSGYFGILSALGNDLVRMYTGKSGAADFSLVTFPALEGLVFDKGFLMSAFSYLRSGNIGDPSTSLRFLEDVMTNLNQTLRIARNQALAHTEVAQTLDEALSTGVFRGRASEFERAKMDRDLKVFKRLYRGDYGSRFMANLDRYEKTPASAFRNSETLEQLQDTVKPFMESAWKRSQTKSGVDPSKFKRLLQEGYVKHKKLHPNVTDAFSLRESRKFADFIARTKSKEAVRDIVLREQRDEALSQVRKRLVQEGLRDFLATKGY